MTEIISLNRMKFKDAINRAVEMFSSSEFIKRIKDEDPTMLKHLQILKEINKLGYITQESQAGRKHSGISASDRLHYEISERAYISGFMLEEKAEQFIKQMALQTDKNAIFVPMCSDDTYIPSKLDIPLTITKKNNKIEINTHTSVSVPESGWEIWRKEAHINKNEKIVLIFCWDTKWNRDASSQSGIFTEILDVLTFLK